MKKMMFALCLCVFVLGIASPLRAEDVSSADVFKKLNDIEAGQKQILDALEQVKAELQIVKVRATNR